MQYLCFFCVIYSILYIGNHKRSRADSILAYNFSSSTPNVPLQFSTPAISMIRSLGVRAKGNKFLILSEKGLILSAFDHDGGYKKLKLTYPVSVHFTQQL